MTFYKHLYGQCTNHVVQLTFDKWMAIPTNNSDSEHISHILAVSRTRGIMEIVEFDRNHGYPRNRTLCFEIEEIVGNEYSTILMQNHEIIGLNTARCCCKIVEIVNSS